MNYATDINYAAAKTERDMIQGIADTLQRVYGDATQTVLDKAAASEVWKWLLAQGVAPASYVAQIVQAAGGEIKISESQMVGSDIDLTWFRDERSGDTILRVRTRQSGNAGAGT